jgi:hypothetical protein
LEQPGVVLDEAAGVREVTKGCRLGTNALEPGLAFLAGSDDASEEPLQLARDHEIANVHGQQLNTDPCQVARRALEDRRADRRAIGENVVDRSRRDDFAERELELEMKGPAKALIAGNGRAARLTFSATPSAVRTSWPSTVRNEGRPSSSRISEKGRTTICAPGSTRPLKRPRRYRRPRS